MQLTGIVYIKIDGQLQMSDPGAALNFGGYTRVLKTGHKVYGHVQSVAPSDLTFTTQHGTEAAEIIAQAAKVDATIEFITDTGVTFILRECASLDPPVLTDNGEGIAWHFGGQPVEPQS